MNFEQMGCECVDCIRLGSGQGSVTGYYYHHHQCLHSAVSVIGLVALNSAQNNK
jgi:hypothetical protein